MNVYFTLLALIMSSLSFANNFEQTQKLETITLGAGCFWCVEAIYQELNGVVSVSSGYMGGTIKNPSYKEVCAGNTGHAEVVQIKFDPKLISLTEILEVFWSVHDPTTLNKQGNDVGTQYRSVVFCTNDEQKQTALDIKRELNIAKVWTNPVVTEISLASEFYKAEDYHQNYYLENKGENPYCSFVITPKLEKFRKVFEEKLK